MVDYDHADSPIHGHFQAYALKRRTSIAVSGISHRENMALQTESTKKKRLHREAQPLSIFNWEHLKFWLPDLGSNQGPAD
jgi:hypothetical protein